MRESRTCGSERGAPSNGRPYRNREGSHRFELFVVSLCGCNCSPYPARGPRRGRTSRCGLHGTWEADL